MAGTDLSFKDKKYFLDGKTYNCPFCNRRNVRYEVISEGQFFWSIEREVWYFLVRCLEDDCRRTSFHLSNHHLHVEHDEFAFPPKQASYTRRNAGPGLASRQLMLNDLVEKDGTPKELDDVFFFHQPTSFFTVDSRIPEEVRTPLAEADNCRKNNFLTGASACLRKAIYKLLKKEEVPETDGERNLKYDERIEILKGKFPLVEDEYFDSLKAVQGITSQEVHENEWEDFDGKTLLFLQEVTREVLYEIYILPDELKQKRSKISELKARAFGKNNKKAEEQPKEPKE